MRVATAALLFVLAVFAFSQRATAQNVELVFADLPGWTADNHAASFAVFHRSCASVLKAKTADTPLDEACQAARALPQQQSRDDARGFFETHFTPRRVDAEKSGLMTGYYEPEFAASRTRSPAFSVPMLRRPRDLVGKPPPGNSDLMAARRLPNGTLVPFPDRAAIEAGALDGQGLELAYMKNPFDLFTLQVQGSGRLNYSDGTTARIAYDGKNGQPYTAIGKTMIERGLLKSGQVTMQMIGRVLDRDPALAADIMRSNRSYVFFKEIKGHDGALGPFGAQGVPLTAYRSIAVDPRFNAYGNLFFVDGVLPDGKPFRALTLAQDTGSAIKGAARIDLFTGRGTSAAEMAGKMQQPIALYALIPRPRQQRNGAIQP